MPLVFEYNVKKMKKIYIRLNYDNILIVCIEKCTFGVN